MRSPFATRRCASRHRRALLLALARLQRSRRPCHAPHRQPPPPPAVTTPAPAVPAAPAPAHSVAEASVEVVTAYDAPDGAVVSEFAQSDRLRRAAHVLHRGEPGRVAARPAADAAERDDRMDPLVGCQREGAPLQPSRLDRRSHRHPAQGRCGRADLPCRRGYGRHPDAPRRVLSDRAARPHERRLRSVRVRNLGLLRGPERVRWRPRTDRHARHGRRRQHRAVSQPRLHPPAATRTSRPLPVCCPWERRSRSSEPGGQSLSTRRGHVGSSRRGPSPRSAAASARVFSSRGHPLERDVPSRDQRLRALAEHLHVGMLDLPAPGHLLDDELRVQADEDGCRGIALEGGLESRDHAAVLGDVVASRRPHRRRPR